MLYPMFFMDLPQKPWRGHLSGSFDSIINFFNKPDGYKNFILHYARLAIGKVDAFIIGSELIGLTKISDGCGNFPAVNELIDLAEKVKAILGPDVIITYAADWSEYHHTEGGWYNLDPLWASSAIDVIGIDAYFPITDTTDSKISKSDIEHGWVSGEGYDWYNNDGYQNSLSPAWAWKNIEYWWSNHHFNPNGAKTKWQPMSKKIWFTEFGFPLIDKSTNQPNVFYNPECIDGGVPKHSKGSVDFAIQRNAIRSSIEHFKNSPFVERMFLWTWDARPYPAWPHGNNWRDGNLWSRGHWVNNKFGSVTIGSILIELCERAGIDNKYVDISSVDEVIGGFIIDQRATILDIINLLRYAYCFDIISGDGENIKFIKRDSLSKISSIAVTPDDLIKRNDHSFISFVKITKYHMPNSMILRFYNQIDYKQVTHYRALERVSYKEAEYINLPITMSKEEADILLVNILCDAYLGREYLKISLPITYIFLEPADVIIVNDRIFRIRAMSIKGLLIEINAAEWIQ